MTAEICYDMLSPGHPIRKRKRNNGRRKMIQAPQDIREGVANACQIVKDVIHVFLMIMFNLRLILSFCTI